MATTIADIISVPVLADLVDSRQYDRTGILLGTQYIKDVTGDLGDTAAGGQTLTLPYIADTGTDEVGVQDVDQANPCATLEADKLSVLGLDVEVHTSAVSFVNSMDALKRLQSMANPEEVMAQWVTKKAQSKILRLVYDEIDSALTVDADVTATNTLDAAGNAELADFHKLATLAFGDALEDDTPLNLLHSRVMLDVFQDPSVQQAVSYGARNDQATWLEYAGYNWKKSDAVPVTGTTFSSYMILPNGVLVYLKFDSEFFGDTVRLPNALCFNTVFPFRYAVGIPPLVNGKTPVARLASTASLGVAGLPVA